MTKQYNQIELREGSTYKAVEILEQTNIAVKIRSYGCSKTFFIPKGAVKEVSEATIEKRTKAYEECEKLINTFGVKVFSRTSKTIIYMLNEKLAVVIHKDAYRHKVDLLRVDRDKVLATYDNLAKLYRIELLLKRIKGDN